MEFVIHQSRHHNCYPLILSIIKDQDNECNEMGFELYKAGLTIEQGGVLVVKYMDIPIAKLPLVK